MRRTTTIEVDRGAECGHCREGTAGMEGVGEGTSSRTAGEEEGAVMVLAVAVEEGNGEGMPREHGVGTSCGAMPCIPIRAGEGEEAR